jgi:UDP-glucose 4-epimerase
VSGRVLVTGASGFVGRALVAALARAGKPVRAATRDPAAFALPRGAEVTAVGDFRGSVDWAPLLAGVDAVVHLAGIAHIGPSVPEAEYDRVMHLATGELAGACARAGVRRLVFLSSVRAQTGATADHVLRETDPPLPSEAYGRAKLRAEEMLRASALDWTILRPTMIFGPGVKGNLASLVRLVDSAVPLPFASFDNRRSLLALENLVAAIRFVLATPATQRETYIVADPDAPTVAEIVAALRRGLGRPARLFPFPPALLKAAFSAAGRSADWERLGGSLVANPAKLIAVGWRPDADTLGSLARMAASSRHTADPERH